MSHPRAFVTHLSVQCDVRPPFWWNSVIIEYGLLRAFGRAKPTVDALIRIDIQHRFPFVKAIGRANNDAIFEFAAGTELSYDHRHDFNLNEFRFVTRRATRRRKGLDDPMIARATVGIANVGDD